MSSGDDRQQTTVAFALASVVSQVGCMTVILLLGALGAGLWVDNTFNTRPLFTILLMVGSIPLNVYLVARMALSATAGLNPPPPETSTKAESLPQESEPIKEESFQ